MPSTRRGSWSELPPLQRCSVGTAAASGTAPTPALEFPTLELLQGIIPHLSHALLLFTFLKYSSAVAASCLLDPMPSWWCPQVWWAERGAVGWQEPVPRCDTPVWPVLPRVSSLRLQRACNNTATGKSLLKSVLLCEKCELPPPAQEVMVQGGHWQPGDLHPLHPWSLHPFHPWSGLTLVAEQ